MAEDSRLVKLRQLPDCGASGALVGDMAGEGADYIGVWARAPLCPQM